MTTLSLLDLIDRPSSPAPARERERPRSVRERGDRLRGGACTANELLVLFERERRDRVERDRGSSSAAAAPAPVPTAAPRLGTGPTLDDLLTGTWDTLTAGHTAACPMCAGPMEPRYAAGPIPVGGRCGRCATELS
jgi:hypothetical protein